MIAVLRVLIFSYFLLLNRVSKKASLSIIMYQGGRPDPPLGIWCNSKALGIRRVKSIQIVLITWLSDGGPIKLKVSGSSKEFLDLARSYLYLKAKVSKEDGSNLDGASKVGFTKYPIASLSNQVDVILGGKLISSATNTYAHRSMLELLLNCDKKAAELQLDCGLFCKVTDGKMEEMDVSADPVLNMNLGTRSEWTKTNKIVELQGRIHSDIFNQEKLILNGVDLSDPSETSSSQAWILFAQYGYCTSL